MFRKVAIALVAASVFTAPVLAQETGKAPPATTAVAPATKDVKGDKTPAKHHMGVRHHRHSAKAVKHVEHGKYAHHTKRAKVHQAVEKAPGKPVATKPVATTNGAAPAPASAKPATKSGTN